MSALSSGSSLFSVVIFLLTPDAPVRHPQMAQIAPDNFMVSAHLFNLRHLRITAGYTPLPREATGVLSTDFTDSKDERKS